MSPALKGSFGLLRVHVGLGGHDDKRQARSLVQELDRVLEELLRILKLSTVARVGIEDQLGVRNVLGEVEGIDLAIIR